MSFIIWPRTPEEGKAFENALLAHGSHDQKSHGNWAHGGSLADNPDVSAHVSRMDRDSRAIEPKYTRTLQTLARGFGGKLQGLKFRFKGEKGILDKIERKMEKGKTPEEAAASITDSLRYTVELPANSYVKGIKGVVDSLSEFGDWKEIENSWVGVDEYNGVNAVFQDKKTGLKIEVQFHTPESWDVKQNKNHGYYEFVRKNKGTPAQRLVAVAKMTQNAESVTRPKGIEEFISAGGLNVKEKHYVTTDTLFAAAKSRAADLLSAAEEAVDSGKWSVADWEDFVDWLLGYNGQWAEAEFGGGGSNES